MNRSDPLTAKMLRLVVSLILPVFVLSACCSLGQDFCFQTPGSGDCPSGYLFVNDARMDDLGFERQGRAGVSDRSGRGGVKDRDDDPATKFCLPLQCETGVNCLDKTVPAAINVGDSNKQGVLVGEMACQQICDPATEDCTDRYVIDPGAVVDGEKLFCIKYEPATGEL